MVHLHGLLFVIVTLTNVVLPNEGPLTANIYDITSGSVLLEDRVVQYVYYTSEKDFNTARQICRSIGGDLAKIETDAKRSLIAANDHVTFLSDLLWVGMVETTSEHPIWVSDCSSANTTAPAILDDWSPSLQCNVLKEDPELFSFYRKACDEQHNFLCEVYTAITPADIDVTTPDVSSANVSAKCQAENTTEITSSTVAGTTSSATTQSPATLTQSPTTTTEVNISTTKSTTAATQSPTTTTLVTTSTPQSPTSTPLSPTSITQSPTSTTLVTTSITQSPTSITQSPTSTTLVTTSITQSPTSITQSPTSTTLVTISITQSPTSITQSPTSTTLVTTSIQQSPTSITLVTTSIPQSLMSTTLYTTSTTQSPTSITLVTTSIPQSPMTTQFPSTQSTTQSPTTTAISSFAPPSPDVACSNTTQLQCRCSDLFRSASPHNVSIDVTVAELVRNLTIDVKYTSAHRRKLTCAEDKRQTARFIGYSYVLVVVVPFCVIVISDILKIVQDSKKYCGCITSPHA